jgi:proline iminopeptidase
MNDFYFIESEKILNVEVRGKFYPVVKAGEGIPCLLIGLGSLLFRTLSKNFANIFQVYSSDVYWVENKVLDDSESVAIDTIIDDIKLLGEALNLNHYVIFSHSAFGILALEFAKKYPQVASALIMVGTPVNFNNDVIKNNDLIFNRLADQRRKLIDAERRTQIAKEDLTKLSLPERWLYEYIYRDAPRYWHIPDFDCTELWKGIILNKLSLKLFTDILPEIDVLNGLEKIDIPIFLAAGMSDYDCCPWLWKTVPNLPKNFTISIFNRSGHWPHYEESEFFDKRIKRWMADRAG